MKTVLLNDKKIKAKNTGSFNVKFKKGHNEYLYQNECLNSSSGTVNIDLELKNVETMTIGHLSRSGYCFFPDEKVEDIYEILKTNPSITGFTVIENNTAIGFLTRTVFNEILGGQYGFSLYAKNTIRVIMKTDFLIVDYKTPIDQVSFMAMQRPFEQLYNPIVVEKNGDYSGIVTVKDLLDTCTKIAIIERNEIALMRDNLKIGLFFMNSNYIIQDQYSIFLEELFSQTCLNGKSFIELLSTSYNKEELNTIKDYLNMVFEGKFEQSILDDINPLMEMQYSAADQEKKKFFHCDFATIKHDNGEVFALVSVYDISARIELQQKLAKEENKRQEEMKIVFELLQVEPHVFNDFYNDTEKEFNHIEKMLKNENIHAHNALVDIYQSVHAVKSNAVILGLNTFGDKLHDLESKIKDTCNQKEISFNNMLNITMDIEKLIKLKDGFKKTIKRIKTSVSESNNKKSDHLLTDTLIKTINKTALDLNKKVKFVVDKIDNKVLKNSPRRIIKEVLIQLIRNSIVHGIELPEERLAGGKKKTGIIRLSIKMNENKIHIKLGDDGRGLNYKKIAEKALRLKLIKPDDINNKSKLIKIIFSPGFSTADSETVHGGRGIGLNLVRDRLRDSKGSIKVKTKSGKGTVFHIYFPV